MTLDEAIKDMETIAEENQRVVDTKDVTIDMLFCDDEEIEERLEKYQKSAENYRQLAEWLKELKQLRERTRWIPVGEKLPEEKVEVLATTGWESITIAERYSANDYFINEGATNADEDDIIAWMPLPEPYKAESRV